MKFSVALISLFSTSVAAFAPSLHTPGTQSSSTAVYAFVPNDSKFAYGLPGAVAPFEQGFDPAGIAERSNYQTLKTFRESEVTHGRVAMLAGMSATAEWC